MHGPIRAIAFAMQPIARKNVHHGEKDRGKLIMELRERGLSGRKIAKTRHMSMESVCEVTARPNPSRPRPVLESARGQALAARRGRRRDPYPTTASMTSLAVRQVSWNAIPEA